MLSEQPEFETPPPRSLTPWIAGGILVVAAVLLALAVFGRGGRPAFQPADGRDHPAVGKQLTRLALQPLTGNPPNISLDDLPGHVTLINFWGPWCGPCLVEFPHLKELELHFRGHEDFRFVSVSSSQGEDEPGLQMETLGFLRQQRAEFPTYSDRDQRTRRMLLQVVGEFYFPTTIAIGRDGTIRAVWLGYAPGIERQMREVIEQALAEPTPGETAGNGNAAAPPKTD
jgi:thiol-disulfide isomerase/thioredoxin